MLSAEEVEAILIHELAHIKRRDYLVNMLQSLVEIVLFFNPAVLWVSGLIKTERENCCDDLALVQNNDKLSYIRALVSCEEYQASVAAYAMGLSGGRNTLLHRVKRMANNRNYSLNLFEKTVLAVCLVVLGVGVSAFTAREDIKKALKTVVSAIHKDKAQVKAKIKLANSDTTKKKPTTPLNDVNESLNKVQLLHPDTLKTTGNADLDALLHNVDSLRGTNNLLSGLNAQRSGLQSNLSGLNGNLSGLKGGNANNTLLLQDKADAKQLNLFNNKMLLFQNKADTNPVLKLRSLNPKAFDVMHDIGQELYRQHLITDTNHLSISLNERELIVNNVKMSAQIHEQIYRRFGQRNKNAQSYQSKNPESDADDSPANDYQRQSEAYKSSKGDYQPQNLAQQRYWAGQQRKIVDQMQREGLIESRKDLSFTLTDKTFVINGMVQNGEVFQRYRQEYVPADAGDNWTWNYTGLGSYPTERWGSRDWDAYSRQNAAEQQRVEAERDKKLVADLMQDGLITDPNNVTFTLNDKEVIINGKKKSGDVYKKYKDKYIPNNNGSGWSWTYSHH
jgi:hypothetical protein